MAVQIRLAAVPRNNREWFLTYLFNDEDFIESKEQIIGNMKILMSDKEFGVFLLLSSKKGIISQLVERTENNDNMSLELSIIKGIGILAKQFNVSVLTIEQGIRYRANLSNLTIQNTPSAYIDGDEVVLRLSATMRFADIKNIYPYVSQLQSELSNYQERNRSKVRPDLIYAIYKQRLNAKTFKEIYGLYAIGDLPGYDGENRIVGEEALARMYRKFKPAI